MIRAVRRGISPRNTRPRIGLAIWRSSAAGSDVAACVVADDDCAGVSRLT
jgi:hypothetical protein